MDINKFIKKKSIAIMIMIILVTFSFLVSANIINIDKKILDIDDDPIDIRVAVYTDEKETDEDFYSPYRRTCYFIYALRDYSWKVGDTTYRFVVDLLPTRSLYKGLLTKDNYDVLLYPPDTPDEKIGTSFFRFQPRNILEIIRIKNFIKQGGGYFGTCGGSMVAGGLKNKPNTLTERIIHNLNLGISDIKVDYEEAMPLLCQIRGLEPDAVGPAGSYLWYSGWNQTNYSINYHTGVCLDAPIDKDNPIFDDYLADTRRIRWIGGPSFIIPENPDRKITVLANFPEQEISDNESTDIHYWEYTGGVIGLIKGLLRKGELYYFQNLGFFLNAYCFASDWKLLEDKPVVTNFSNKPFMTSEVYPNENQARILLCAGHPEHNVWWGGYIEETEDNDWNNQYEAFYRWKEVLPEDETVEDEFTYNHWIIRRSVAWASQKVPDEDLPPIYGPSEVRDIYPYVQKPGFTIYGNSELSKGVVSLELYYRFSNDNLSWSDWTSYECDNDEKDGWSWDFDALKAKGGGFYQFYSIRRVEYENHWEIERAPMGPDAMANIKGGWYQMNEDGFNSIFNRATRGIEIFKNSLVVGTANYNNESGLIFGESYPLFKFLKASVNGTFSIEGLKSDGCEIWSYDDKNWRQLVGNKLEGLMKAGFGDTNNMEVGFLIEYKDYLYAGLRNQVDGAQIWRTNELEGNWELVIEDGFGNQNNIAAWTAEIFNDNLFVGTMNFEEGCEIFKTNDGKNWEIVVGVGSDVKSGFGTRDNFYAWSMCVYGSSLFIGTDNLDGGGEIWKSRDGVNCEPVIAYKTWIKALLNGADYPRGFSNGNLNYRGGIRRMVVFNDELYFGVAGEDTCFSLIFSNIDKKFTFCQGVFQFIHPIRRLNTIGCEIWKYNSSIDEWTRIIGGFNKGNNSGGFGDIKNEYVWSMITYDDYLYVGTIHPETFEIVIDKKNKYSRNLTANIPRGEGELWRYDGDNWVQINIDGFGDEYNIGIRELIIFNNSLIAGTMNLNSGCEIWKYT